MADPTVQQVRDLLSIPDEAFPEAKFKTFYGLVQNEVTNTTDQTALLYAVCYKIALAGSWNYVTRLGERSFSPPDPEPWKKQYLSRCNELRIKPMLLGRPALRKMNTDLDDYPDNLNT